jgi:hypothetical protein
VCREPDFNLNIWLIVNQGGFGTEIKTFCVLFFVNERTLGLRAALRGILNFTMGSS